MKTLLLFLLVSLSSFAQTKAPELIVVATDKGGYPAKALCFFSNNYMVAHPSGLLVQYTCLGGPDINSEIWLVKEKPVNVGTSVMGNLFTEPFVRGEDIYFFEYNEFETVSLWKFSNDQLSSITIPQEFKNAHIHDFALVGDTFYFRYTNHASGEHGEGVFKNEFKILPKRSPEFFWKSSSNGEIMIQKTKLAVGEVVELRSKENSSPTIILKNRDADSSSPFKLLRNQFALRGTKWATIANTDKGLTLVRGENGSYSTEDLSSLFKDIQYWPPALTQEGEVIFRGTDMSGQFALWGYKDGAKRLIVGSGQEIAVEAETVVTSSKSLLYNAPLVDPSGKLFIGVGLRDPGSSVDFGQGIIAIP